MENFSRNRKEIDIHEWVSGPLIAFCLSRDDAVDVWKSLMGHEDYNFAVKSSPTCLRALYGENGKNPLYGSECESEAQREIKFFFPGSKFTTFAIQSN